MPARALVPCGCLYPAARESGGCRPGTGDADRRRTESGQEEIFSVGRWIAAQEISFDLIALSPLARAQETATIVADALD
jgi:phosphohistidine phosphatase SixA